MVIPSVTSTMVFVSVIAFVAVSIVIGIWRGGSPKETVELRKRWGVRTAFGMAIWIIIGAIVPASGVLETKMLPPPPVFLIGASFLLAFAIAFSKIGKRLSRLPLAALIGFHAYRLPLEMVLHYWYVAGTMPVQMTYEGHNFDIASGILAIIIGIWAFCGYMLKAAAWIFNIVGTFLLGVVIFVALTSSPFQFRQYTNEPAVLLIYHFPYSWIVTLGVTGALLGHLVLFRKLSHAIDCFNTEIVGILDSENRHAARCSRKAMAIDVGTSLDHLR